MCIVLQTDLISFINESDYLWPLRGWRCHSGLQLLKTEAGFGFEKKMTLWNSLSSTFTLRLVPDRSSNFCQPLTYKARHVPFTMVTRLIIKVENRLKCS